ncbi:MAG: carboxypeptidase-like regulatory domain-containing protein [Thermodesulfobacteriota bacterium]
MKALISEYHLLNSVKGLSRELHRSHERAFVGLALLVCLISFFAPDLCAAAPKIPGEEGSGFLYALTHLHPVAYLILLLVFILSVLNLLYQGLLHPHAWPTSVRGLLPYGNADAGKSGVESASGRLRRGEVGLHGGLSSEASLGHASDAHEGVVGPRRVARPNREEVQGHPTPLDGLNHPLPKFVASPSAQSQGVPRMVDRATENKGLKREFRFTAAVDLPPPEEMEKREREKLVVSGRIMGSDGKALAGTLVFLTDPQGNRVGQSARSAENTGEFKVQAHEPGKYVIQAYKRGYLMENTDPLTLPVEAGRIEGIDIRMIPEGCLVQGHVQFEGPAKDFAGLEVRCLTESADWSRSSRLDPSGTFRIAGIPHDSSCVLEVKAQDGTVLGRTDAFYTNSSRELYRAVRVTYQSSQEHEAPTASGESPWCEPKSSGEHPHQPYSADSCKAG